MRLRWLGCAGFHLESSGSSILIDPFLTRNQRAFPRQELKPVDFSSVQAILVTHGHLDHLYDVPEIAAVSKARVYASTQVCRFLANRGVAWEQLIPLEQDSIYKEDAFNIEPVPSSHVSFDIPLIVKTMLRSFFQLPYLMKLNAPFSGAGQVFGFIIQVEEKTFFHLGSAFLNRDALGERAIKFFLVPVQGRTDICELAAELVVEVRPEYVIPHHHDDFLPPLSQLVDLQPFIRRVEELLPKVRVMVPSMNQWLEF